MNGYPYRYILVDAVRRKRYVTPLVVTAVSIHSRTECGARAWLLIRYHSFMAQILYFMKEIFK